VVGYLGAGSNLGNREGHLRSGLLRLGPRGIRLVEVSSLWETEPVGAPGSGWFLNLCAAIETTLPPVEAMRALLAVEEDVGRIRTERNAPRTLDLDLLLLDDLVLTASSVTLPHPRMWERRFVLAPLAEIAPALRNPRTGRTVAEELAALSDPAQVRRVGAIALAGASPV
jgi:2-amino-4-hydroxy-6-hydroxymethyldihydropteridine diphosphokinase